MYPVNVLIPTYNRPDFLRRTLDFFNQYGKDFYFIIGDSSNPYIKKQNRVLVKKYKNLKIRYLDNLSSNLSLHTKLAHMTKYVDKKYCVFCPDDDFIFPESIRKCVDFLVDNPSYVCAHGDYIGYHQTIIFGKATVFWKKRYTSVNLNSSAIKRFKSHMSDYRMVLWSVRKSSVVKKIYSDLLRADFSKELLFNFGEILPDVLTVINGKVKRIDCLYGARQYFGSIHSYFLSLKDAKREKRLESDYLKFKSIVQENLKKNGVLTKETSLIIDEAMEDYIRFSNDEHLINRLVNILNKLPVIFLKIFRNLHAFYIFNKDNSYKEFRDYISRSKYNQQRFKEVKSFIT